MPRMTTTSYPSKSIRTRSTEWSRQVASSASKVVTGTRISVVFQGTGLKQCVVPDVAPDIDHVHAGFQIALDELGGKGFVNAVRCQFPRYPFVFGKHRDPVSQDRETEAAADAIPTPYRVVINNDQRFQALTEQFPE